MMYAIHFFLCFPCNSFFILKSTYRSLEYNNVKLRTYIDTREANKWPGGIVPYMCLDHYENGYSGFEKRLILESMQSLQNMINEDGYQHIKFVEWKNEINFLKYFNIKYKCESYIGMLPNSGQSIHIGEGCFFKRIIQHELLHALGVWHEHSRYDRDSFVTVNLSNVIEGKEHNFNIVYKDTTNYGHPYDYESLMHYSKYEFSKDKKNKKWKIQPKQKDIVIGEKPKPSNFDIIGVRYHYPSHERPEVKVILKHLFYKELYLSK